MRRGLAVALGFFGGLLLWRFAVVLMPASGADVLAAKAEGIVSFTVVEGYSKAQESFAWLLGCVLAPLGAWTGARLSGDRGRGRRTVSSDPEPPTVGEPRPPFPHWRGAQIVLLGTIVASALRPGFVDGHNPWGTFGFLAEEGVYLGAVQALRTGRDLYVDVAFPYGPMLAHPLDWWLGIFGDTVAAARRFALLGHLLSGH